jgi:hypothetical protein
LLRGAKKLDLFWGHSDCSVRQKLLVHDAVIRSKLMYGLESLQLNESALKRLDTFQLKGLRKILKLKTTYIDRANSNARVFELAEQALQTNEGVSRGIQKLSEFYLFSKLKLFAKTVALSSDDPRSAVTFSDGTVQKHNYGKRRVGRPRLNWIDETTEQFWKTAVREHMQGAYLGALNLSDEGHVSLIRATAKAWDRKYNLTGESSAPGPESPGERVPRDFQTDSSVVYNIAGYAPGRRIETH